MKYDEIQEHRGICGILWDSPAWSSLNLSRSSLSLRAWTWDSHGRQSENGAIWCQDITPISFVSCSPSCDSCASAFAWWRFQIQGRFYNFGDLYDGLHVMCFDALTICDQRQSRFGDSCDSGPFVQLLVPVVPSHPTFGRPGRSPSFCGKL